VIEGTNVEGRETHGAVAWVAASVAAVRREAAHGAEQVTQALQGEVVAILRHEDGWVLARLPDGYEGWIRDWHLRIVPHEVPPAFAARANARVDAGVVTVRVAPQRDAAAVGETVLGTCVVAQAIERSWVRIELPAGCLGWVPSAVLRDGTAPWPRDMDSIATMLRRFIGVPYVWGGRSPKGFDCSGLVQFVYGLHGIDLRRDSHEQAVSGAEVTGDPAPGDLLFFGRDRVTHVAVALDADIFLHARGEVRCNSLRPGAPSHDADLRALWCGTRRVLEPMPVDAAG